MQFKNGAGSVQEISVFHWSTGSLYVYLTNSIETGISLLF
jgi:hypothetical protein